LRLGFVVITTLSILALLFVSSSIGDSYAASTPSSKQQSLALTITSGSIANAGPQMWTMSGGSLELASDTATSILAAASWNTVSYTMSADVNGLTASGRFYLALTGTTTAGQAVNVRVNTIINSSLPAVCFPSYSVTGVCASGDTSEIPAYFMAYGHVRVETGSALSPECNIGLVIEDAALNPFGAPIVISSMGGSLLVVATYNHARTEWQGVQTAGTLTGTLGSTTVSGGFVQAIQTNENYVTGTATDNGQISLVGMSPAGLNSQGHFHGVSTIPTTGTMDCSPAGLPGTCTETGYVSTGTFTLDPSGMSVSGNYNVQWPAPSIIFGGSITAKVQ